jgi:membrane protein DedA with SNARE-associated domain
MSVGGLIAAAVVAAVTARHWRQLPTGLRALAVAAVAGLLAYGSGLVGAPDTEGEIRHLAATLGVYTYVLVGVLALLETGAGMGFIVPGEIAVVLGGVSAGQGEIALIPLIAIVWACALTGDLISFALGRRLGQGFVRRHGPKFGISASRIAQVEQFYAAHGGKTLILGRFIGFVRPLSPFIAGASKMPVRWFVPCTTIAAGLWAITFSVLGYLFSRSLNDVITITERGTLALSAVLVVAVAAIAIYSRARGRQPGTPAAAEGD